MRVHHGAVDQEALTSRAPAVIMSEVKIALKSLGLDYKRDGNEYKLRCARPKKPVSVAVVSPTPSQNGIRHLLRRPAVPSHDETTIYGDPSVDPGQEVRFSVELCKIKNLPGLYIVDMRRLRGNVWTYKFIYRTLMDTLKLGDKNEYLNNTTNSDTLVENNDNKK